MERLAQIEQLIEVGREEGPRLIAERAREAVDVLEGGLDVALATVMDRVRPEARRGPGVAKLVLVALVVALSTAIVGFVVARLVEQRRAMRGQRVGSTPIAIPVVSPAGIAQDDEPVARTDQPAEALAAS
jgi:hypothetical protein